MQEQQKTLEQIKSTITAAKDSVWVIQDTIKKLDSGEIPSKELKRNLERNVGHLKIITSSDVILNSGEDISELLNGIEIGQAKLEKVIWG